MNHYPMTDDQRQALDRNLATIMEKLGDVASLLRACYDAQDPPVWRAAEALAAMQRLLWALQRVDGGLLGETAGEPLRQAVLLVDGQASVRTWRARDLGGEAGDPESACGS
ncbi:MAG: hypothetical protein ABSH32_31260 [Bryobacteraceae bacterium]|jgi:hypothetical protein